MAVKLYPNVGIEAARLAGESPEMDAAAARVAAVVRGYAFPHVRSGHYFRSIGTERVRGKRGVTDRSVYSDDPAAFDIEFGHVAKDGRTVPGQFIFSNAVRSF